MAHRPGVLAVHRALDAVVNPAAMDAEEGAGCEVLSADWAPGNAEYGWDTHAVGRSAEACANGAQQPKNYNLQFRQITS